MSNLDTAPDLDRLEPGGDCDGVEVLDAREVPLGGLRAMTVYRTLPQRRRSFVGAWCFIDHYGPDDVSVTGGMVVPRHPHTGLATVSWLFTGRIDHLDSGGHSAAVLPGELNLMIAGSGITHQEISSADTTVLHGVQLWYALPAATRFSSNHFEHYAPKPVVLGDAESGRATARVFIGELFGSVSPVDTRTPELLGAEIVLDPGATLTITARPDFEYAVLAENYGIRLNGQPVAHRELGYLPTETASFTLSAGDGQTRVLVLGGVPLGEPIVMWWNFIGRDHDEILELRRRYQAELGFDDEDPRDRGKPALFGEFPPGERPALPAPPTPIARLRPRA